MTSDRGDTLVEILVALAILGIGITGLVAVLGTHATNTGANREQSHTQVALLAGAEYVKSLPFAGCTPTTWSPIPVSAVPRDPALTIEYGDARALGAVSCQKLAVVTVRVTGTGYVDVELDVVMRP